MSLESGKIPHLWGGQINLNFVAKKVISVRKRYVGAKVKGGVMSLPTPTTVLTHVVVRGP